MKWIELTVFFDGSDKILAEELIANIFYDMGLPGLALAPMGEVPADEWAKDAGQPNQPAVTGYIPNTETAPSFIGDLQRRLASLQENHRIQSRLEINRLDEEDWAESWKAFFWPEKIGRRIVVKPTWRSYSPSADDIVIELDPGMAFGTGTHPTTGMCIQLLENYVKQDDRVLDVGTGSGVLMVAAAKLGAASVWGIDNDEVAVKVAKKNLVLNKIPKTRFRVLRANLIGGLENRFSLVVANILSEVILTLLDDIPTVLCPQGIFICSGITEESAEKVIRKMEKKGLVLVKKRLEEGWCAMVGHLPI